MVKTISLRNVGALVLVLGAIVNILAYRSVAPLLIVFMVLAAIIIVLVILDRGGVQERTAVFLVFAICWFWAGITGVYVEYLDEYAQGPDATYFYNVVTTGEAAFSDGKAVLDDAGAIVIWRSIYDFFSFLGFDKARYIGITANIAFVALTGMLGVKMVKATFGSDHVKIRRFTIIYAMCGMFWLFAAIHLRDAMVLFFVTLLSLMWVYYLALPNVRTTTQVIVATIAGFVVLGLLRNELVFVPLAMLLAGISAHIFGNMERIGRGKILAASLLLVLPLTGVVLSSMYDELASVLASGEEKYSGWSLDEGGASSLGNLLLQNQSVALRLILGPAYIFFSPIPFWLGFLRPSAYHLYKSLHVIFMYGIAPLFGLVLWRLSSRKDLRTPPVLFLLYSVIGFTLSVAYTSLEGRHFGAFLVSLLVLAVLPNLHIRADRNAYKSLLIMFLGFMFVVHVAWGAIKLIT